MSISKISEIELDLGKSKDELAKRSNVTLNLSSFLLIAAIFFESVEECTAKSRAKNSENLTTMHEFFPDKKF